MNDKTPAMLAYRVGDTISIRSHFWALVEASIKYQRFDQARGYVAGAIALGAISQNSYELARDIIDEAQSLAYSFSETNDGER